MVDKNKLMSLFSRKRRGNEASPQDVTQVAGGTSGDATFVGRQPLSRLSKPSSRFPDEVPYEEFFPYLLILLLALMSGDLTSVGVRSYMIPSGGPIAARPHAPEALPYKARNDYDPILARNIFNSDGLIPDIQVADGAGAQLDQGTARESTLPLTLVGTIVHANPGKSVATIQLKGNADKVLPYIPNDDIEGLATLLKVERKKAFIRNLSVGSLEYIQIKDDTSFTFQKKAPVAQDGPVSKEGDNTYAIARSDLETQMSNLPELLTQARAVPNLVPGANGKINGFRILDVVDNSLFTKLGIKNGDVITGVDGEPVNSPAKAMELYNSLRSKNQVQITMERNGQPTTVTYNIH